VTPAAVRTPGPVTLTVSALRPVQLGGKRPAIGFTLRASRTAHLTVTLTDAYGRKLASWHRALRPGLNLLSLPLAPADRHAGARKLRLAWTGGRTKTVPFTLRAPKPRHA
jgi:hypothetical protein